MVSRAAAPTTRAVSHSRRDMGAFAAGAVADGGANGAAAPPP